ncbi:uncharacterized protein LOC112086125 [Eutrema salsugineum]|uniref:uncharacterized protein LOC112086125 n=1 Tax=Eutrema salsugineum TaxID=72664 RepID=UPI000CED572A|nr:uncharacterized protein LOC112086125 [Eutrema salsugineum]
MTSERCLCDLGSSINMMPLSVAKRLGYYTFQPTKISLILADRSVRRPEGVLVDVSVIGENCIPTDFVVLELEREPKDPLILGRPFDVILESNNKDLELELEDGEQVAEEQELVADQEDLLSVPSGPMTRSRTKKLKQIIGAIIKGLDSVQEGKEPITSTLIVIQVQDG